MLELRNVKLEENWPSGPLSSIGINEDGIITEVSAQPLGWKQPLDGRGRLVIPGLIDMHVHDRDPSDNGAVEDCWSVQRAAARGGVTTIGSMANTNPSIATMDRLYSKLRRLPAMIEQHQWFGATPANWKLARQLAGQRRCLGVKLTTGSTTGDLLVTNRRDQRAWFGAVAEMRGRVAVHAEAELLIRKKRRQQPAAQISDHCQIRPALAEILQVQESLEDAVRAGCQVHFCHISTPVAARKIIAWAARHPFSLGICPHHVYFTEQRLREGRAGLFKMNPPLRTTDEVLELQKILWDESLDMVTVETDHAPHPLQKKWLPEYDQCPSGVPSVEYLFPLIFWFVKCGKMSLKRLIDLTSRNPARIFGFGKRKSRVAVGFDADLVVVDTEAVTIPGQGVCLTKCGWTPYAWMPLPGRVKTTIARGRVVYQDQ